MPFRQSKDISPEKVSDYTFMGENIVVGKLRGAAGYPPKRKTKQGFYPINQKVHAACLFAVLGKFDKVSELTNIPVSQLKSMANEQWWVNTIKEVHSEENHTISAKLTEIALKSFDAVLDRLENGDPFVNMRTGEVTKVPVKLKDITSSLGTIIDRRNLLRGDATSRTERLGQDEVLKLLGDKFESFAKKFGIREQKTIDIQDVEVINDEITEVLPSEIKEIPIEQAQAEDQT